MRVCVFGEKMVDLLKEKKLPLLWHLYMYALVCSVYIGTGKNIYLANPIYLWAGFINIEGDIK